MKILVSWSSGKDSAWMLHVLQTSDTRAPRSGLLTTTNEVFDRVAMHGVRRDVLEAQARAAGLPLQVVPLPWPCSNEEYERRMGAAVARGRGRRVHPRRVRRPVPRRRAPLSRGAPRRHRPDAAVSAVEDIADRGAGAARCWTAACSAY